MSERLHIESGTLAEAIDTIRIASVEMGPGPAPFILGDVNAIWCAPAGDPVIYVRRGIVGMAEVAAIAELGPKNSWRVALCDAEHFAKIAALTPGAPRTAAPAPIEKFAWSILHLTNGQLGILDNPPVGDPPLVPTVCADGALEVMFAADGGRALWRYVVAKDDAEVDAVIATLSDAKREIRGMVVLPERGLALRHQRAVREMNDRLLLA